MTVPANIQQILTLAELCVKGPNGCRAAQPVYVHIDVLTIRATLVNVEKSLESEDDPARIEVLKIEQRTLKAHLALTADTPYTYLILKQEPVNDSVPRLTWVRNSEFIKGFYSWEEFDAIDTVDFLNFYDVIAAHVTINNQQQKE